MLEVGFKDSRGTNLLAGQHIIIYDNELHEQSVSGYIKYEPGAFMIHTDEGKRYLLFWYIRDDDPLHFSKDRYTITVM